MSKCGRSSHETPQRTFRMKSRRMSQVCANKKRKSIFGLETLEREKFSSNIFIVLAVNGQHSASITSNLS